MNTKIDIIRLFKDFNVKYHTEGYKQCGYGWLQIDCPYCSGSHGPHLGWNIRNNYFNCWRCGFHSTIKVLSDILNITNATVKEIINEYVDIETAYTEIKTRTNTKTKLDLPIGTTNLSDIHKKYLEKRGFNPNQLELIWDLKGTTYCKDKDEDYSYRIIAPIYDKKYRLITYQGRDFTGQQENKYKCCKKENEIVHIKHYLYGYWLLKNYESVVICEGIADVWKYGVGAVATFGVSYKPEQVNLLKDFKNKYILFDNDEAGKNAAIKLSNDLSSFGGNTYIIKIPKKYKDIGEMPEKEVISIKKEITKN
jgi:5S rRNA maturation endonuclease (ribonuclease M5)